MAKKRTKTETYTEEIPQTLDDHPFFGLQLDEYQKKLVDAVWNRSKKIYLVNSIAGSGKTLISTALGVLMTKYGIFDKVVYITFPGIYEKTQGFLPGDLIQKSEPYFQPLYDALLEINELPDHVCNTSVQAVENGSAYIECAVSTYMRGINIKNAFVIIDEAENADLNTLAKVISRINDDCVAMVIGHSGQCDMYDKSQSGFDACIDYQTKYHPDTSEEFKLLINHRGEISKYADLMLQEYEPPKYGFVYMSKQLSTGQIYIGQHKRTMNPTDIDDSWFFGDDDDIVWTIAEKGSSDIERIILYNCDSQQQLDYMERIFKTYASLSYEAFKISIDKQLSKHNYTKALDDDDVKYLFNEYICNK